jgi:4-hydroxythreonine-4-phosphate dehydrogenase
MIDMEERPIIGISMGDPFGNGPEITVKALADPALYERCRPIVIGDSTSLEYALKVQKKLGGIALRLNPIQSVEQARFTCGTIDVIDLGHVPAGTLPDAAELDPPRPFGVGACALGGEASFQYVKRVIELAMDGEVDATVTNALSKEAINLAGHHYSGHTEIYADFTGTDKYSMLLAHEQLRVVHVSTHVSLREACDRVKKARVLECIRLANDACKTLGIAEPKIGVAGLNPHCGEKGLFGREEIEEIQPAIDAALAEGIIIPEKAPTPPDTVFSKALGGWYDIVVVMYHDQGHIPLKVKGFVYNRQDGRWEAVSGVNVTLGLPIIRVSVDHGTGVDNAGDGKASTLSLVNAIDYAVTLAKSRGTSK